MKELSACPEVAPVHVKATYTGAIVDPRTSQRLELEGDDPFIVYTLDDKSVPWGPGKRPDGVMVAEIDGCTWVCFIEIKGKPDTDRAFDQLAGGAKHFCPVGRSGESRTHGDEHHDAWAAGLDTLPVMPDSKHMTVGVFVTPRMLPASAPREPKAIGGRGFPVKAVHVSKQHPNWARVSPRELLRKAGVL